MNHDRVSNMKQQHMHAIGFGFCSTFTPTSTTAGTTFRQPRNLHATTRPSTRLHRLQASRSRRTWQMELVDGGTLPESDADEAPQEVQFFARASPTASTEVPNLVPSLGGEEEGGTSVEMPLFPLQLVLNPGTKVPLHIFETRYRLMFNRLREENSRFGIVLYEGASNSLALIGCAAEVTQFEPLPDGRIMTANLGKERFKIIRIVEEKPYIRARVQLLHDDAPAENVLPVIQDVWKELQEVMRLSDKLYEQKLDLSPDLKRLEPGADGATMLDGGAELGLEAGWPVPKRVEEFSFAVCQVLDLPLKEQQLMLQTTDTAARLRKQLKMLITARQYLAAQVTIKEAGLKEF